MKQVEITIGKKDVSVVKVSQADNSELSMALHADSSKGDMVKAISTFHIS